MSDLMDDGDEVIRVPGLATALANLDIGEAVSIAKVLPGETVNVTAAVQDAQKRLRNRMSPSIARARARKPGTTYSMHGVQAFARNLDVVVALVVVRGDDDPFHIPGDEL